MPQKTLAFSRSFLWISLLTLSSFWIYACSAGQQVTEPERTDQRDIDQPSVLANIDSIETDTATGIAPADTTAMVADTADFINIDSLIADMSLREKIGQLFFVRANGNYYSNDDQAYRELVSNIKEYHYGGLIFFGGDIYSQAILTNKLQQSSDIPLWITQDMEYGAAMRVDETTRFTPAMGVAATQNPDYAYWMGKVTAREAKALGVHQIFAPVLDVNNNPDNPVINVRSFSGHPDTVAAYGKRFIDGVQSEGLLATAKHFPGHGDTDTDSHLSLPTITHDYARLDSVELVPFRAAVENNISSVMTAHIAFPEISQQPGLPATMDSTIMERLLVDSLQFDGLLVTDGLEMHGISSNFSPGEAAVNAIQAGTDMLLLSPDALTAIHDVELAVKRGEISEMRIEASVRKLLNWKMKQGLFRNAQADLSSLSSKINTRSSELIADEISRQSLTLLKNKQDILPIRPARHPNVLVVSVADDESGSTGSSFASLMKRYHPNVRSHVLDQRSSEEEKQEMLADARQADLVVIGSFIYVRSGQEVQLTDEQQDFIKQLTADKPSALVAFGNPYVVQDLPDTDVQLMAWAANEGQVESAVPALFGGSKISGRLPIEIPGMYDFNHGITLPQTTLRYDRPEVAGLSTDSLRKVDQIMNEAVLDSTFPGGVVAVVKDGILAYQKGFGYETYQKLSPVRPSDVYDLASLTKVTATTPAIMKLFDEQKISLDDKVGKYIPEFRKGKKAQITIRHLLLHNSGLPAFRIYVDKLTKRDEIIEAVKNEPLIYEPGTTYEYSDLGFILLAEIVEKVSGQPINEYIRQKLFYPMTMTSTFFTPKAVGSWYVNRIPPTEQDTIYRDKTLLAEVNDERAWYMNGIAGHAGLFSSAADLAKYTQMLLNNGSYGGRRYFKPATVAIFTRRQSELVNRGYGFDRKSKDFSTAGSLTSDETFGHTGFTGTSYWVDPRRDLAIIILTNRTYPYRSFGKNISRVRSAVADAVVTSIID